MNWLSNIFKKTPMIVTNEVCVPIPLAQKWLAHDQKAALMFLRSEQGRKLVEACRHKLFADHLDACQKAGNAEAHNASMRGANNVIGYILWLATEDSISGGSPVNEQNTDSDHAQSDVSEPRARI